MVDDMRRVVAWVASATFFVPAVVLSVAAHQRPYRDMQRNWMVMGAVIATLCAVLAAGLALSHFGGRRQAPSATPDYDIADSVQVSTVAQLQALGDPLRRRLLDLVYERAASVGQLAAAVGQPKSRVSKDVEMLIEAGLLRVVRARPGWGLDERYFGRTGRTINVRVAYRPGDPAVAVAMAALSGASADPAADG